MKFPLNRIHSRILSLLSNRNEKLETRVSGFDVGKIKTNSNPTPETRPEKSNTSLVIGSNASGLEEENKSKVVFPDPWDGDWNDAVYIWQKINKDRSL
jgi:hypothetical protein